MSFDPSLSNISRNNPIVLPKNIKQQIFRKENSIRFLIDYLTRMQPTNNKQLKDKIVKVKHQLFKETNKLSRLVEAQLNLPGQINVDRAQKCLQEATEYLKHSSEQIENLDPIPLPAWLSNNIEVDARLLAHIVGDTFAEAANLEGTQMINSLEFSLACLNLDWNFSKKKQSSLKKLVQNAIELEKHLSFNIQDMVGGTVSFENPFARRHIKKLLKQGEEVLIPGGWVGAPRGHAIYYKITPQPNGKYTFLLFNRGNGIQYHNHIHQEFKKLYQAFLEIKDVSKEKILDPLFLRAIMEHRNFIELPSVGFDPESNKNRQTEYSDADIYESLIGLLDGQIEGMNMEMEELMSEQRNGTCSWKSLTAVFRHDLGYLPSKRFKLQLEAQALWSFYSHNKDTLNTSSFNRNLMIQATASVTRTLQSLKEVISESEFTELASFLTSIENHVKSAKKQSLKHREETSIAPPVEPISTLLQSSQGVPVSDTLTYRKTLTPKHLQILNQSSDMGNLTLSQNYNKWDITSKIMKWEPTSKNLLIDLQSFSNACEEALQNEQYEVAQALFLQTIRRLPLPTNDITTEGGKFWKEVIHQHVNEVPQLIEAVTELFHKYYVSCFYIPHLSNLPPIERIYAVAKALHIQNILKTHSILATEMELTMPVEFAYLEFAFSDGFNRELSLQSLDPHISDELACIYAELKQMAPPSTESFINQRGLAFEWNFDSDCSPFEMRTWDDSLKSFSSMPLKINPEFTYIHNQLKTNESFHAAAIACFDKAPKRLKDLLSDNKTPFSHLSINSKIAFVYCYASDELLPPIFNKWRNQVLQAQRLIYGPFKPRKEISNDSNLNIAINFHEVTNPNAHVKIEYFSPRALDNSIDRLDYIGRIILPPGSTEYQKKTYCELLTKNPLLKQIFKHWVDNPKLTENDVYSLPLNQDQQQMRELLTLGTNQKLQIQQTLGYFISNIHLLKNPDYQFLFKTLIFEKDYLLKELRTNPDITSHFDKLLKRGYQSAYDAADIENCIFYLNLSRHLQSFVIHVNSHELENVHFLPYQSILKELLTITGLTTQDKSLLYDELLASYNSIETVAPEDVIMIIQGFTFLSLHPLSVENASTKLEHQNLINKFGVSIQKIIASSPSLFLNQALQPIIAGYRSGSWRQAEFPIFESDTGSVLNVLTGDLYIKGNAKKSLPAKIFNHKTYQSLFSQRYSAREISFNCYEFSDHQGNKYRIWLDSSDKLHIQRKIEGEVYELFDGAPEYFPSNLKLGGWHSCWKACNESMRFEMYDSSNVPIAAATITEDKSKEKDVLIQIIRYPDKSFNEPLLWINPQIILDTSLNIFSKFEDSQFICAWQNKSTVPCLIELPRYQLTFKLNVKDPENPRWICPSIKGYHLAASQFEPTMGEIEGYLVLENKKGERQIILPTSSLEPTKGGMFSQELKFNRSPESLKQHYVSFSMKRKSTTEELFIDPSNTEACFYLAYLKLATGRFQEARYLLNLHRLPLRGDCTNELNWLHQIIMSRKINDDTTGQGAALRLHACYMYIELLQRTGKDTKIQDEKNLWKEVAATASTYLNQLSIIGAFQLPLYEEKKIIKTLLSKLDNNNFPPYLSNYLKKIDPESSGMDKNFLLKAASALSISQSPKDLAQKKLLDDVKYFCEKLNSEIEKSDPKTTAWAEKFIDSWINQDIPEYLLYTRPESSGVNMLIQQWLNAKDEDRKGLLTEFRKLLDVSMYAPSSLESSISRAVLEMIISHPKKYTSLPPPPPRDNSRKNDWNKKCQTWVRKAILPILHQYIKEATIQNLIPAIKVRPNRVQEESSQSIRKKKHPQNPTGHIQALPGSMIRKVHSFDPIRYENSAFQPEDFLAPLSKAEAAAIVKEKKNTLKKTTNEAFDLLSEEKALNYCVKKESARLRADVKELRITSINTPVYTIDNNQLPLLRERLDLEVQSLQLALRERERVLLMLVNPTDQITSASEALVTAPFLAHQQEPIGVDKLILLYARSELNTLNLPQKALEELNNQVTFFLQQATYIQQLQRSLEITKDCLEQSDLDPELSQKLVQQLTAEREFDVAEHPQWLVLEYYANFLIRKDQHDKLEEFARSGDINAIHQIIMGAGKTSVLMLLLALFLADGKYLSVLMIPEELLESVFSELKSRLGEGFMQMLFPFDYGRESDYSVSALIELKEKLEYIQKNKQCLIGSPKSFRCFYLKFKEIWRELSQSEGEKYVTLKAQFECMRSILNLFRKEGAALMDEVDLILDCRSEVNFPIGKMASIKERDMDLLLEIYDILLHSKTFRSQLCVEFDPDKAKSSAPPFSSETYHSQIKKPLAIKLLSRLKDPTKMIGDKKSTDHIQKTLKRLDDEILIKYLCHVNEDFSDSYDYVEKIEDHDTLNILRLAYKELNTLLPQALQEDCDENYGVRTKLFATPLAKGKPLITIEKGIPVEKTRFADPFETANYTFQTYYKTGIPKNLVKQQIEILQKAAIEELKKGKNLNETSTFQEFLILSGGNKLLHLLKLSESDLDVITEHVNSDKSLKNMFLKRYVFRAIQFQTRKLNSNSQTLGSFFGRTYGFSGTTWNADTYHDSLKVFPSAGTDARTICALLGSAGSKQKVTIFNFTTPMEFIRQLPYEAKELALIDNGAYLKGESILPEVKEFQRCIQFTNSEIKGIVFFDDDNKKVILEKDSSLSIPLVESRLKPKQRFTIYTKPFTTGAHIDQADDAVAYFTISRNLLLRDYLQSVFRMRKIESTQQIRLCISSEVEKVIYETLKKDPAEPITHQDILIFAVYNQANQIGDDNYVAIKQKMFAVIEEAIIDLLLDPSTSPEEAAKLYNQVMEDFFAPSTGEEPIDLYKGKPDKGMSIDILTKDIQFFTKKLETILSSSDYIKSRLDSEQLKSAIADKANPSLVPEELTRIDHNSDQQLAEVQQETQEQTQTQTKQQTQSIHSKEEHKKWRYFPWPKGNIYKKGYYTSSEMELQLHYWEANIKLIKDAMPTSFLPLVNWTTQLPEKLWTWSTTAMSYLPGKVRDMSTVVLERIKKEYKQNTQLPPWTYPLSHFLVKNPDLHPLLPLFMDDSIKVSFNFAPKHGYKSDDKIAVPFDDQQKLISHLLIAQNIVDGTWEVTLLDQLETEDFKERLNVSNKESNRDYNLCLMDTKLGSIQKGKFSPTDSDLTDEQLQLKITKVKFLIGNASFDEKEIELLQKWISPEKWKEIKEIYYNVILAHTAEKDYTMEALDNVFKR